jgi:hypothetical protein
LLTANSDFAPTKLNTPFSGSFPGVDGEYESGKGNGQNENRARRMRKLLLPRCKDRNFPVIFQTFSFFFVRFQTFLYLCRRFGEIRTNRKHLLLFRIEH